MNTTKRVRFQLLDKSLKINTLKKTLPNLIKIDDTQYECDDVPALGGLDAIGSIKVTSWERSTSLSGNDEQVITDDGKVMIARVNGGSIKLLEPGLYECMRCGHIQKIPGNVKYHICKCERKGPFKEITPREVKTPWKMPGEPKPTEPMALFEAVVKFIREYVTLPDERLYALLGYWIMGSWVANSFPSVPYLFFLGPRESGKTRALEVLQYLSYRAIRSSTITPAALYRTIEKFGTTLLIDEAEMQLNLQYEQGRTLYGILNAGYKKGDTAIRCVGDDNQIEIHCPYGFKALSSTKSFIPTLESRCILINMEQHKPKRHLIDEVEAQNLRGELLWRCTQEIWSGNL